ncbi:MAG: MFS transporter [Arthrobacter sp.]|jgi:MFS family permease|nr:MFS transporter [Arthrobacter sp.]
MQEPSPSLTDAQAAPAAARSGGAGSSGAPGGAPGANRNPKPSPAQRTARLATITVFFAAGLGLAWWVVSIPGVEARVGLSHAVLGTFLLLLGLGSFLGMTAAGPWVDRRGSRRVAVPGAVGVAAGLGLIAAAHEPWQLAAGLLVFGLGHGVLDVAMNDQAVLVQRWYGRPIMSNFHAFFSVGAGAGSLLGALAQGLGAGVTWVLGVGAVLSLALVLVAGRGMVAGGAEAAAATVTGSPADIQTGAAAGRPSDTATGAAADTQDGTRATALPGAGLEGASASSSGGGRPRRLPGYLLLAGLAFLLMLAEGVANDWSSLHAVDELGQSPAGGALAYAAVAVAMVVGRFSADAVVARVGGVAIIRGGSLAAALGLFTVVLSASFPLTLVGWAVFGLGVAGIVPQIFTAAGELGGEQQGKVMSRVVGAGYLGMLAGPAIIGWVSPLFGLGWALLIPVACCVVGLLCAGRVRLPR